MEAVRRNLSKTKKEWMLNRDLCISRQKLKKDGTLEKYSYKIYVSPAACRKIIEKKIEFPHQLTQVRTGQLPNPTQIELSLPRIMQLAVFN